MMMEEINCRTAGCACSFNCLLSHLIAFLSDWQYSVLSNPWYNPWYNLWYNTWYNMNLPCVCNNVILLYIERLHR
jgi:hypothetical protein